MTRHRSLVLTSVASAVLVLTACTGGNIDDFPAVHAIVDAETGSIALPLDAYVATDREGYLIEHANALMVDDCMEKSGYDFPRADDAWDTKFIPAERRYGLRSATEAAASGYDIPTDSTSAEISRLEETYPTRWWDTVWACIDSIDQIPMSVANSSEHQTVVDIGIAEARGHAQKSDAWVEATNEWADCLSDRGIPTSSDDQYSPTLPEDDAAAQKRYAVADVACKKQVDYVQRLGDVEAKYQAIYIDDHEEELEDFRVTIDGNLTRAQSIIDAPTPTG